MQPVQAPRRGHTVDATLAVSSTVSLQLQVVFEWAYGASDHWQTPVEHLIKPKDERSGSVGDMLGLWCVYAVIQQLNVYSCVCLDDCDCAPSLYCQYPLRRRLQIHDAQA